MIASGCIPAHASFFTVYEYLKKVFEVKNEEYEFLHTAMIGASTTIAHDFFIAPSDGKSKFLVDVCYSDQVEIAIVFTSIY